MNDWKKIKIIKSDSEENAYKNFCKKALKLEDKSKEDLKIAPICDGKGKIIFKKAKELVYNLCEKVSLDYKKEIIPVFEVVRRNDKESMAGVIWFTKYTSPSTGETYIAYTEKTIM